MKSFKDYLKETSEALTPQRRADMVNAIINAMYTAHENNGEEGDVESAEHWLRNDASDTDIKNEYELWVNKPMTEDESTELNDDPTNPGWYLVDTQNGQVCDGPFETSRQAIERKSYPSESPQFWNGSEWTEDDSIVRMAQLAGVRH